MLSTKQSQYRWTVVALIFFATSINYIDRQVIGLLKPILEKAFTWSEKDYGYIVMAFQTAYALGLLVIGRWIDVLGTKKGYAIAVVVWSTAAMLHAFARSAIGFAAARVSLGVGESGNFPAAIKSITEWFPKKERALATGIANAGTNMGAIIAPIMVPLILAAFGWQMAFVATGVMGFVWLIFWLMLYHPPEKHPKVQAAELAHIHSDAGTQSVDEQPQPRLKWHLFFSFKQTWGFVLGKFLTDPIWWFFLFWLPDYFSSTFHIDVKHPGWALVMVYTASSIGSIGGGYLSSKLIQKGWAIYQARKVTLLFFACCVLPVLFIQYTQGIWFPVALLGLAAAAHQGWSANMYTIASDMFPKKEVSTIIGIGGMAGAAGGILFPIVTGSILEYFKSIGDKNAGYNILFIICAFAYLVAWLVMQLLMPKMEMVKPRPQ